MKPISLNSIPLCLWDLNVPQQFRYGVQWSATGHGSVQSMKLWHRGTCSWWKGWWNLKNLVWKRLIFTWFDSPKLRVNSIHVFSSVCAISLSRRQWKSDSHCESLLWDKEMEKIGKISKGEIFFLLTLKCVLSLKPFLFSIQFPAKFTVHIFFIFNYTGTNIRNTMLHLETALGSKIRDEMFKWTQCLWLFP